MLVGTAVFLVVSTAAYQAYVSLIRLANENQARLLAVELANEQFEIVRNMPYVNVGLTTGIPVGVLPQNQTLVRGGFTFGVKLTIRNINLSSTTLQASSKLVEVDVDCTSCQNEDFQPIILSGQVAPANLQSAASGGAVVIQVYDSNGAPVEDATVVLQSIATSSVTNTDVTNNDGVLNVIGVPPGNNVYRIIVTKTGYSSARTYPVGGGGNPNPTVPDATVIQGQVTQVSLSIDRVSTLSFTSVDTLCAPVGGFDFNLTGAKEVGTGVPKYSEDLVTNGGGTLTLSSIEGDTYSLTPIDGSYNASGVTPFSPISVNAGNDQTIQLIVVPKSDQSLQVSVQDNVTLLPLSGVTVRLYDGGSYDETMTTGQGFFAQTDWSGGGGQSSYSVATRYFGDDGNVDVTTTTGSVILNNSFGDYSASGRLESSTFDMGTTSNFYALNWAPISQSPLTGSDSARFQFASSPPSDPSGPWTYVGPDGTAATYYTIPGTQLSLSNNGNQYARYMMYLTTATATATPSVNDVSFTYTSGCIPPGQVLFQGLSAGDYTLDISKSGYSTETVPVTVGAGWQTKLINLGP